MCDKNQSKVLYDRLVAIVVQFAKSLKESLNAVEQVPLAEDNCEQYLEKFGQIWQAYPVKIVSEEFYLKKKQ